MAGDTKCQFFLGSAMNHSEDEAYIMEVHMLTQTLNINEVKAQLSQLIEDVAAGTEVIIAKAGKPSPADHT
ncbi:MAG: type II toxin-antitoxin system prevent-host-death family antitoxin [Desulfobacterales bacterium]|nr:type II toxin-antitoxin system prevent-host-death family antitoxin [Desulfobacterales bacterium]